MEAFQASRASFESDELWFVVLNLAIVLACVACTAIFAGAIVVEVFFNRSQQGVEGLHKDLHVLHEPELGVTMADGGEPKGKKSFTDRT
jgi:hypothetical protein